MFVSSPLRYFGVGGVSVTFDKKHTLLNKKDFFFFCRKRHWNLAVVTRLVTACPAYTKPWVQFPAAHKQDMVPHAYNPSSERQRQENRQSKRIMIFDPSPS